MAVYKRGKNETYYFEFIFKGRRIRESTHQGNKRAAEQMEAAKKTQLGMVEHGYEEPAPVPDVPTLQEFSKRFFAWLEVQGKVKPRTVLFYRTRIGRVLQFEAFKSARLDQIDAEMVAEFTKWRQACLKTKVVRRSKGLVEHVKSERRISPAGVNRELATLRRILRIAREWKVISSVPAIHLSTEVPSDRILDHEEEASYLDAASPLLREFATVAVDTGLRPEEILRMRWENVHFDPAGDARYGYIHNPSGKTKAAKRNIPITPRVKEILEARHELASTPRWGFVFEGKEPETQVSYNIIQKRHGRVLTKTHAKKFRIYDLRHTYLTRLGESGADAFTIMKLAGHVSIETTQRYVHPTPERMETAMGNLEKYNQRQSERAATRKQAS
jgi:integrase